MATGGRTGELGELAAGSRLVTREGKIVRVESVQTREGSFKLYNIEVGDVDTYCVSGPRVLVRKSGLPKWREYE